MKRHRRVRCRKRFFVDVEMTTELTTESQYEAHRLMEQILDRSRPQQQGAGYHVAIITVTDGPFEVLD